MNVTYRFCLAAAALAVVSFGLAPSVEAQEQGRTSTVLDRQRPELDPLGVRMGAFFLFPKMSVTAVHDDNIFRTEDDEESDLITIFSPSLRLTSNWSRHQLGLAADAKIGRYADNGAEDYDDYNLSANGRVDVTRRANFDGGLAYSQLHEERGSPDDANGINPTEYTLMKGNAGFNQSFNRVKLGVGGILSEYDYDDVATDGGGTVNNDDRDREHRELFVRLGYTITPSYEAFVRASVNERDYDSATDDSGLNRDSDGYGVQAGTRLDLGGIAFGDVFVGYRSQKYDDPSLPTISGLSYGAALTWNVTQLTTAKLDIRRTIEETTQDDASGNWLTVFGASVDHELRRNVLVGAKASFANSDYRGISREDDTTRAGVYAKYMMSRYLYLSAGYDYASRDSTEAGSDYDDNQLMLRLEGQL